jgi:hypothetical protein
MTVITAGAHPHATNGTGGILSLASGDDAGATGGDVTLSSVAGAATTSVSETIETVN